ELRLDDVIPQPPAVEIPNAIVGVEQRNDELRIRLALVEGNLEVGSGGLRGLLQCDLRTNAGGGHENVGPNVGAIGEPEHDLLGGEVAHEVLLRPQTGLKAAL